MEERIRILSIIIFFIMGLSHICQPKIWIGFFKLLVKQHFAGAFINGFITLPLAVLIVSFHNVWSGAPVLLTVMGWAALVKSMIAFCFPQLALSSMKRVERNNLNEFRIAGIVLVVAALVLTASFFF